MKRLKAGSMAAMLLMGAAAGGPAMAATNTPQEIANKRLVAAFYRALDAANSAGTTRQQARIIAERFISPTYIQHREGERGSGNGREAFIHGAEAAPPGPLPPAMRAPAKTVALMAEGDRVIIVSSRAFPDGAGVSRRMFIFNMFRIANGKLAEHWDALPAAVSAPSPGAPAPR